jgi:putative DNA primase/helicase
MKEKQEYQNGKGPQSSATEGPTSNVQGQYNGANGTSQDVSALVAAATKYRDEYKWVPLRLRDKNPECMGPGWTKRTVADPIPNFQPGDGLGVLTGKPSGGLVRLDPDFPAIADVTRILFPAEILTFGRNSSPGSGRLCLCPDLKSEDFTLPRSVEKDPRLPLHDGKPSLKVFQVLSTGKQTMVPPSIHPNGEPVVWQSPHHLETIGAETLLWRVGLEAFLMAVRQFWPPRGDRNYAAMALARVLLETLETRIADEDKRMTIV